VLRVNAIDTHIINNIANVSGIPLVSKYVPCLFSDEILEEPRDLSKEENSIFELFEYYQSGYGPSRDGIPCSTEFISAFKTKIFSGQLRNITEFAIDEELQPDSDSIWKCFQNTFVVPEVHVNGKRTYSLIDTGASCSAMSIKFYQTEAVKSLKLVFRKSSRIVRMADNKVNSEGILENVPVTINNHKTNANTILMNDLSYDLILGRDWCNANGVIIDFNKRKIYLLKPPEKSEPFVLINHLEDNKSNIKFDPTEHAHLIHPITIKPYHEALISVRSKQNDSTAVFAKCYEPLGERFGVFTVKGIVQFKSNLAQIVVGNLTSKEITLPVGTIVAKLEAFNEHDYEIHSLQSKENDKDSALNGSSDSNENTPIVDKRRFIVKEDMPNRVVHWKPLIRRNQTLIVGSNLTLKRLVDKEIYNIERCSEPPRLIQDEMAHDLDEEFTSDISFESRCDSTTTTSQPETPFCNSTTKESYEEVKIDESNLTKEQIEKVKALLKEKAQVFSKKNEIPSQASNITHSIDTENHPLINCAKYRTSHKDRPIVSEHVKEMLRNKVIEPSKSPWAFPIVLVPKKMVPLDFVWIIEN
jgi:hypothetical protein